MRWPPSLSRLSDLHKGLTFEHSSCSAARLRAIQKSHLPHRHLVLNKYSPFFRWNDFHQKDVATFFPGGASLFLGYSAVYRENEWYSLCGLLFALKHQEGKLTLMGRCHRFSYEASSQPDTFLWSHQWELTLKTPSGNEGGIPWSPSPLPWPIWLHTRLNETLPPGELQRHFL